MKHLKGCADCDNSKILRAASFNLAKEMFGTDMRAVHYWAKRLEGFAKNYGNRRVARERDPERKDA